MTCEFIIKSKFDAKGEQLSKSKQRPCGESAGNYKCNGSLAAIKMALCDQHRDFVIANYGWILTKIKDEG